MKQGYVYIMTNEYNTTFYVGVTSDLIKRFYEHKSKFVDGFTKAYNLNKLVYFEQLDNISDAIEREKKIKNWHRNWKINLIKEFNPKYKDLYKDILNCCLELPPRHSELVSESQDLRFFKPAPPRHSELVSESPDRATLKQVQGDRE
jgi:putative endonuclease